LSDREVLRALDRQQPGAGHQSPVRTAGVWTLVAGEHGHEVRDLLLAGVCTFDPHELEHQGEPVRRGESVEQRLRGGHRRILYDVL